MRAAAVVEVEYRLIEPQARTNCRRRADIPLCIWRAPQPFAEYVIPASAVYVRAYGDPVAGACRCEGRTRELPKILGLPRCAGILQRRDPQAAFIVIDSRALFETGATPKLSTENASRYLIRS